MCKELESGSCLVLPSTPIHLLMPFLAEAAALHSQGGGGKSTSLTRKCDHYGCLDHTSDICYQKQGSVVPKCKYCICFGHTMDVCYAKFVYPPGHPKYPGRPSLPNKSGNSSSGSINSVASDGSSRNPSDEECKDGYVPTPSPNITQAQFQQLMALLQKTSTGGANTNEIPIWANLSHSSTNLFLICLVPLSFFLSTPHTHLAQLNHTTHP